MMCKSKGIMPFLQLFVGLIFLVKAELTSTETDIFNNITPLHYKLALWPHIQLGFLFGVCNISIHIEQEIQTISLNSSVPITKATLEKIYVSHAGHIVATYNPYFKHFSDIEIVTLYFNETIKRGHYLLTLTFNKNLTISNESDGIIRTYFIDREGNKRWIITTRVRSSKAFFPCWNSPHVTTTFQVSVYHPKNYMALSNSEVHCLANPQNDMIWTYFQSTPPIFPHCINIVVMPIYYDHDLGSNVRLWTSSNITSLSLSNFKFATNIIYKITDILTRLKLVDYCKVARTNYIAIRNFPLGVIATPAFVLYRHEDIIVPIGLFFHERIIREPKVAFDIVHEIVYQWILRSTKVLYKPSLSMRDLSNFLTIYILQKILPEFKIGTSPIRSIYEHVSSTLLDFNMDDIIDFIFSSRTILASLCNSNNFHEEELALKSMSN